jgi:hypothetical protein
MTKGKRFVVDWIPACAGMTKHFFLCAFASLREAVFK